MLGPSVRRKRIHFRMWMFPNSAPAVVVTKREPRDLQCPRRLTDAKTSGYRLFFKKRILCLRPGLPGANPHERPQISVRTTLMPGSGADPRPSVLEYKIYVGSSLPESSFPPVQSSIHTWLIGILLSQAQSQGFLGGTKSYTLSWWCSLHLAVLRAVSQDGSKRGDSTLCNQA